MNTKFAFILWLIVMTSLEINGNEPQCSCSKFHYEEKILEKIVRMEFAMENMKSDIEDAKKSVIKTVDEFHRLKSDHEKKFGIKDNVRPAFSVRLSAHLRKLGHNQPIVFDNILTNVGQAYSGSTGVFTAPKEGLYHFTATTMSFYGEFIQTEIVRNGDSMVKMFSSDKSHEQGTSAVVLHLKASDEVWVRHMNNEGENLYGDNWSTFSGFQI